jgi:hypothetical protein
MNSTLNLSEIEVAREKDTEGARAAYDAEFRNDLMALLDRATIEAAVVSA